MLEIAAYAIRYRQEGFLYTFVKTILLAAFAIPYLALTLAMNLFMDIVSFLQMVCSIPVLRIIIWPILAVMGLAYYVLVLLWYLLLVLSCLTDLKVTLKEVHSIFHKISNADREEEND